MTDIPQATDEAPPALEVRDLDYRYPDGRQALSGVRFAIQTGQSVGIIGPNGAGKSTLLLHLNGVLPERHARHRLSAGNGETATNGVWVAGLEVNGQNLPHVRQKVGLLFQDPDDQLFCPTVLEDVAFGPLNLGRTAPEARAIAGDALAAVGLIDYQERVPHQLSMGERKRVCLAGVLACQPEILALDEPTSNLDPRGRRRFIELIGGLATTKIIATHDLEMVLELCNRVLLMDQGQVCADGPSRDVLARQDLLEEHGLEVPLSLERRSWKTG